MPNTQLRDGPQGFYRVYITVNTSTERAGHMHVICFRLKVARAITGTSQVS